jgi:hypothetical protein
LRFILRQGPRRFIGERHVCTAPLGSAIFVALTATDCGKLRRSGMNKGLLQAPPQMCSRYSAGRLFQSLLLTQQEIRKAAQVGENEIRLDIGMRGQASAG